MFPFKGKYCGSYQTIRIHTSSLMSLQTSNIGDNNIKFDTHEKIARVIHAQMHLRLNKKQI